MYNQMYAYLNKILLKWQCVQHMALPSNSEKWRQCFDKGGISGALLTGLSKAFDCRLHDLLIAKLTAYAFDYGSLVFMQSYPSERQQRTKVNNVYSTYSDMLYGVPQGTILDPLLFNIYIRDRFYDIDICDIPSYADDNTPYTSDFNLEEVIQKLELTTNNLFEWLKNNHMKASTDKCYLLVTRDTDAIAKIGEFDVKNSREEKLLGAKNLVSSLCKNSSQKLHGLERVVNFKDLAKRKSLMKAFITSQFNYCPLIWMFHSRQLNN